MRTRATEFTRPASLRCARHAHRRRRGLACAAALWLTGSIGHAQTAPPPPPRPMSQEAAPGLRMSADPRDLSGMFTLRSRQGGGQAYGSQASAGPPAADAAPVNHMCVPDGQIAATPGYPIQIVQTARYIAFINEMNRETHVVYMDGTHPAHLTPSHMGHSIGHWQGDTLVVDTAGLEDLPDGHALWRVRKLEGGRQLEMTLSTGRDAMAGTLTLVFNWRPELHLEESLCEDFMDPFGAGYYAPAPGK
jgi:hypothetical protein